MTQLFQLTIFWGALLLGSHAWSSDCAQLFIEKGKTPENLTQKEGVDPPEDFLRGVYLMSAEGEKSGRSFRAWKKEIWEKGEEFEEPSSEGPSREVYERLPAQVREILDFDTWRETDWRGREGELTYREVKRKVDQWREYDELSTKLELGISEVSVFLNREAGLFETPIGDFSNQTFYALMNVLMRKLSHYAGDTAHRIKQVRFWTEDLVAYREGEWNLGRWIDLLDPKNRGKYREFFRHFERAGWRVTPAVSPEGDGVNGPFYIDRARKEVLVNLVYLEDRPPFLIAIEIMQRAMMEQRETIPMLFDVETLGVLNTRISEALGGGFSRDASSDHFRYYIESAFAEERARVYREVRELFPQWRSKQRESPIRTTDAHGGELRPSVGEREYLDSQALDQIGHTFSDFLLRNPR